MVYCGTRSRPSAVVYNLHVYTVALKQEISDFCYEISPGDKI